MQAVPPHQRRRHVHAQSDDTLSCDQLYQQLMYARQDIQVRDTEIERLQLQVLEVSAQNLDMQITAYEQHLQLFQADCRNEYGSVPNLAEHIRSRALRPMTLQRARVFQHRRRIQLSSTSPCAWRAVLNWNVWDDFVGSADTGGFDYC